MKFLSHIRSRSRLNNGPEAQLYGQYTAAFQASHRGGVHKPNLKLPARVLGEILAYICPHTQDEEYTTSEQSMIEDGCMLCDMRDLAQCALTSRQWAEATQNLLYHSVRIDAVHYCEREVDLAAKRKRRSFFERNGDPKDAPQQRLQLFLRTVRANEYLANLVEYLKMPYMTRETCKTDLARTVSVLPNLRYLDLPEGFYSDDPSSNPLRQELQTRCPDIRKMRYLAGSEGSFSMLAHMRQWQNLEILELANLTVDPSTLLFVLASFPALHEVKLASIGSLDDGVFVQNPSLPPFPPLDRLCLEKTPSITAFGLISYLSQPTVRELLTTLTLSQTGIAPASLHQILLAAPHLSTLTVNETVDRSFPLAPTPPLASRSLRTLRYQILSASNSINPPSETYYSYVSTSLLSSSLPALTSLYAYSSILPDLLLFPPSTPFAQLTNNRFSATSTYSTDFHLQPSPIKGSTPDLSGLVCPLSLYTKSAPELEWNLTFIDPPSSSNNRRGSATATRPVSLYTTGQLSPPWGGLATGGSGKWRDSTIVGNGFGGYLNVPSEEGAGKPGTGGGRRKSAEKGEGWMG